MVSLYGFAYFNTEKLLSQAFFPLKNLNHSEQNYATLHLENVNVVSNENLKKNELNNNLTDLVDIGNFEKSYKAIDSWNSSGDKRLNNFSTEKPHLLIGLKYIRNDDQDGGSLYLNIYEGKNFFDRNKPDKFPSNYVICYFLCILPSSFQLKS